MIKTIKAMFWLGYAGFLARVGNLLIDNDTAWVFISKRVIVALRRALSYAPVSEGERDELCAKINLLEHMRSLTMERMAK